MQSAESSRNLVPEEDVFDEMEKTMMESKDKDQSDANTNATAVSSLFTTVSSSHNSTDTDDSIVKELEAELRALETQSIHNENQNAEEASDQTQPQPQSQSQPQAESTAPAASPPATSNSTLRDSITLFTSSSPLSSSPLPSSSSSPSSSPPPSSPPPPPPSLSMSFSEESQTDIIDSNKPSIQPQASPVGTGQNTRKLSATVAAAATVAVGVAAIRSSSPDTFSPSSSPSSSSPTSSDSFSSRLLHFHHSLSLDSIPRSTILSFVFAHGVPEQPGLRPLVWKLLLGYLPWEHKEWEASLKQNRGLYEQFVTELTVNPFKKIQEEETTTANTDTSSTNSSSGSSGNSSSSSSSGSSRSSSSSVSSRLSSRPQTLKKQSVSAMDDPLGAASSEWTQYYKDQSIRDEIEKDVRRTYSSFHFFNERVRPTETTKEEIKQQNKLHNDREAKSAAKRNGNVNNIFDDESETSHTKPPFYSNNNSINYIKITYPTPKRKADETHHDVIKRILFIYAKLNPGVRYVQGMNEILAPIYYVFAHDASELFKDFAEADAFFCFTTIMSEIRDRFIKSLDAAPTGILAVVSELNLILKQTDYVLWQHLETCGVDPRFYSFRWLTLLVSQEFELPEVLRLWDSLFADSNRFEFLLLFCTSMIVCQREELLAGEFADVLRILQHTGENQSIEFSQILRKARELRRQRDEVKEKARNKKIKQREEMEEREQKEREKEKEKEREKERERVPSTATSSLPNAFPSITSTSAPSVSISSSSSSPLYSFAPKRDSVSSVSSASAEPMLTPSHLHHHNLSPINTGAALDGSGIIGLGLGGIETRTSTSMSISHPLSNSNRNRNTNSNSNSDSNSNSNGRSNRSSSAASSPVQTTGSFLSQLGSFLSRK